MKTIGYPFSMFRAFGDLSFRYFSLQLRAQILILSLLFCVACSSPSSEKHKQHLRLNIVCEPPTLDSRKAGDTVSANVIHMLFEGLMRLDENLVPQPALAEKIEVDKEGLTYTFTLRKAYWSNGDPITTDDFLYSWQKILDPAFPGMSADKLYVIHNALEIKQGKLPLEALGVDRLDEKTLRVHLRHPAPYFLQLLAFPFFYPVHAATDRLEPEWAAHAGDQFISNGPFCLATWEHENQITLIKNPLYWDKEAVHLNSIHLSMIDDVTTEYYMYEMNELDWAGFPLSSLPPDLLPSLIKNGTAEFYNALAVYYYALNTNLFPLNNVHIRRALSYAINRTELVEHVTQGWQIPAMGMVPPIAGWETPYTFFQDHDVEGAHKEFALGLAELGLENQLFPKLTLCFNTSREHQKIAQVIQHQWLDVLGIQIELEHLDWKVYLGKLQRQDYQIARHGWAADFSDPLAFLAPFKYCNESQLGGQNRTGWESAPYQDLLEAANFETDFDKRADLLKQAEALLISEMPVIPIYYINCWYLKKTPVHGILISPLGIADFKKAYLS